MNKKPFSASDGPMLMLIGFGAMLIAQLIVSVFVTGVAFAQGDEGLAYELVNLIGMLCFQGVFLAVFLLYTKKHKLQCDYNPLKKLTVWSVVAAPILSLVCLFSFLGLAELFDGLLAKIGFSMDAAAISASSPISIVLMVLATVGAAPICEELIFRVGLLSGLNKLKMGAVKMCLISGICFALMHMNPAQTVYQFLLGSAIAYVVIKTGSALPGMIMHATSNAVALVLSFTKVGVAIEDFYGKVNSDILIMLLCCILLPIVGATIVWLAARYLAKAERAKYPQKFIPRKVIWIDEVTFEPIFEGEEAPVITEENRIVTKGYSPVTGAPVIVDRLELQKVLLDDYNSKQGGKQGKMGKNTYKKAFVIYLCLTLVMWVLNFGAGIALNFITDI